MIAERKTFTKGCLKKHPFLIALFRFLGLYLQMTNNNTYE